MHDFLNIIFSGLVEYQCILFWILSFFLIFIIIFEILNHCFNCPNSKILFWYKKFLYKSYRNIYLILLLLFIMLIIISINYGKIEILQAYIALIAIVVSAILLKKQLEYENRVNSYKLLEKILNSLEKIDKSHDKKFRLWVIKQMLLNEHVLFYDIQIRLAYINYKNNKTSDKNNTNLATEFDDFKDILKMDEKKIEDGLIKIYAKIKLSDWIPSVKKANRILNNQTPENLYQCTTRKFETILLVYLDTFIKSKCVKSFLKEISQDTYKFYDEGYLYHLPNSKLKYYLSELNNDNKSRNQETILKNIWDELKSIIEKETP